MKFDLLTTVMSAATVVLIGLVFPLINSIVRMNQRIINLERETPIAIAGIKEDIGGVRTDLKELVTKFDLMAQTLARMEGQQQGHRAAP